MRIDGIRIENYRGIQLVEASGLGSEPVILISGKNGTGKTLILEAIVLAWSGHHLNSEEVLGPWANETVIEIECQFTDDEQAAIESWMAKAEMPARPVPRRAKVQRTWQTLSSGGALSEEFPIDLIRSARFQRDHKFGVIDFLASNRSTGLADVSTFVDLSSLANNRREEQQKNEIQQFLSRSPVSYLGDVVGYLAAADYMDLIALRNGESGSHEFDLLTRTFYEATGKSINRPEIDPVLGMQIQVNTVPGVRHRVSDLSAGEREALSLLYFARTLNSRGGVLLLDEPEQHLHPILQVALFELMSELAEKSQVLTVSHSANLISSMPTSRLFEMIEPRDRGGSQLVPVGDESKRLGLFSGLGIRPAAMLQNEALLIVEGNRDETTLRSLYPIIINRFRIVVAGGVREVMQACQTLENVEHDIPWLCLRDRDLLSDVEVRALQADHPNLYIWNDRMIENELLDPQLISAAFARAGHTVNLQDLGAKLREAAQNLKDEVLVQATVNEISRRHALTQTSTSNVDRLREHYVANAEMHARRAADLDVVYDEVSTTIASDWDSQWRRLVNGKQLMARMVQESPFRTIDNFVSALAAAFSSDESLSSPLAEFKQRLATLLSGR